MKLTVSTSSGLESIPCLGKSFTKSEQNLVGDSSAKSTHGVPVALAAVHCVACPSLTMQARYGSMRNPAIDFCECILCPQKSALFVLAHISEHLCALVAVARETAENVDQ